MELRRHPRRVSPLQVGVVRAQKLDRVPCLALGYLDVRDKTADDVGGKHVADLRAAVDGCFYSRVVQLQLSASELRVEPKVLCAALSGLAVILGSPALGVVEGKLVLTGFVVQQRGNREHEHARILVRDVWLHLKPVSYTHLRAHETGRNLVC